MGVCLRTMVMFISFLLSHAQAQGLGQYDCNSKPHYCGTKPNPSHPDGRVKGACYTGRANEIFYKNYCCCDQALIGPEVTSYCTYLGQDDPDGWMYPWLGQHPDPEKAGPQKLPPKYSSSSPDKITEENYRCISPNFCYQYIRGQKRSFVKPNLYRFGPAYEIWDRDLNHKDAHGFMEELTNRLRFTKSTVAQEGLSFCVVGRHLKRSPLVLSETLKGFQPLIDKSLDIGNHIDPDDPNKMNRFDLPEGAKIKFWDRKLAGLTYLDQYGKFNSKKKIPPHEYENVYLGARINPICLEPSQHGGSFHVNYQLGEKLQEIVFKLEEGFYKRPAHPHFMPHKNCKNPYRVHVTMIEADGVPLHNYLHIRVYAEAVDNPQDPFARCPTGKIKFLMLEVRDQEGYPVGQFTDDIPCDQDEATANAKLDCPSGAKCRRFTGTKNNNMPCMFTHPDAVVHPSIFMMAANGESNSGTGASSSGSGNDPDEDTCRFSWKEELNPSKIKFKENENDYFTEVHATWRFAQMNPRWISELHFATLIVEDETPIQYYTSRQTLWVGPEVPYLLGCGGTCGADEYDDEESPGDGTGSKCCNQFATHATSMDEVICSLYQFGLINRCVNETHNTNRPYGYSAKYSAIKPTFKTMGGYDYFPKRYIVPEDVNCHVDITFSPEGHYDQKESPGKLSHVTIRRSLWEYLQYTYLLKNQGRYGKNIPGVIKYEVPDYIKKQKGSYIKRYRKIDDWGKYTNCIEGIKPLPLEEINTYELGDWHTLGISKNTNPENKSQLLQWWYYGKTADVAAKKMFRSAHQDPVVLKTEFPDDPPRDYFGSQHLLSYYSKDPVHKDMIKLQNPHGLEQKQSMKQMGLDPKQRCPCPFIPTTAPPELQTKTDQELDGRQTHVINMTIAWMILVPLAFFVIRFYKETFSKVFFLQEYWWYTIHLLCLITAPLFMFGGIYGMRLKRKGENYKVVWTDATMYHIYGGYTVITIYLIHLCLGAFRAYNLEIRLIQIALHWGIGWFEYAIAATVILAAVAIPSGTMNCYSFGIYVGFLVFQITMTLYMEYHLHHVSDPLLHLVPPRHYLPSPMMRVFHRDAPYSRFRAIMLAVFFLGCVTFYFVLHASLEYDGFEASCFQPVEEEKTESIF